MLPMIVGKHRKWPTKGPAAVVEAIGLWAVKGMEGWQILA